MKIQSIIVEELEFNRLKGNLIKLFLLDRRARFIVLLRFLNLFKDRNNFLIKLLRLYYIRLGRSFGTEIPHNTNIGRNLYLPHPFGIIIHPQSIIGQNCSILQQVTIGNPSAEKINDVPVIQDNVVISAGAKIIGKITIESNCIIGANSVVTKDFSENSIVVGVPGKNLNND